jgi:hypothetical protein
MPRVKEAQRAEHMASAHFNALDIALERGDYVAAGRAQQALAELGWDIRHRRTRPHEAHHEANGQERGQ